MAGCTLLLAQTLVIQISAGSISTIIVQNTITIVLALKTAVLLEYQDDVLPILTNSNTSNTT